MWVILCSVPGFLHVWSGFTTFWLNLAWSFSVARTSIAVKCSSALANVAKTDAKLCGHISWVQNKASTDHNLNFLFFTLIWAFGIVKLSSWACVNFTVYISQSLLKWITFTDDVFKHLRRCLFLYKAVVLTFVRCHCEKIKMLSQYLLLFSSIRSVDFEYFLDFLALGVWTFLT